MTYFLLFLVGLNGYQIKNKGLEAGISNLNKTQVSLYPAPYRERLRGNPRTIEGLGLLLSLSLFLA